MFLNFQGGRIWLPSILALRGKERLELKKRKAHLCLRVQKSPKKLVKRIENKRYNKKLHYYK